MHPSCSQSQRCRHPPLSPRRQPHPHQSARHRPQRRRRRRRPHRRRTLPVWPAVRRRPSTIRCAEAIWSATTTSSASRASTSAVRASTSSGHVSECRGGRPGRNGYARFAKLNFLSTYTHSCGLAATGNVHADRLNSVQRMRVRHQPDVQKNLRMHELRRHATTNISPQNIHARIYTHTLTHG